VVFNPVNGVYVPVEVGTACANVPPFKELGQVVKGYGEGYATARSAVPEPSVVSLERVFLSPLLFAVTFAKTAILSALTTAALHKANPWPVDFLVGKEAFLKQ